MMTRNLERDLQDLLDRIEADPVERHQLEPQLHRLFVEMRAAGIAVPDRLRRLDETLVDEGVEAQFDNLPL